MGPHLDCHIEYSTDFNCVNAPEFRDCCIHLICTGGKGTFTYNNREFTLSPRKIAVIPDPDRITELDSDPDFSCEYITAPVKFLNNLLPANNYSIQGRISLLNNPIIEVSDEDAVKFLNDLHHIRDRKEDTGHLFYPELTGSLLLTMIYDLFDFHAKVNDNILTTDRVGHITIRFFTLLESGIARTRREVAYYADRLNVSSKYLSDIIKRVTGNSVSVHINHAATAIIIEYLGNSNLSITQIADEMNFTSVSYFSRYCRKHLGVSPAMYRLAGASKTTSTP